MTRRPQDRGSICGPIMGQWNVNTLVHIWALPIDKCSTKTMIMESWNLKCSSLRKTFNLDLLVSRWCLINHPTMILLMAQKSHSQPLFGCTVHPLNNGIYMRYIYTNIYYQPQLVQMVQDFWTINSITIHHFFCVRESWSTSLGTHGFFPQWRYQLMPHCQPIGRLNISPNSNQQHGFQFTHWEMNSWNVKITGLKRKIIFDSKPQFWGSMLFFQGVVTIWSWHCLYFSRYTPWN